MKGAEISISKVIRRCWPVAVTAVLVLGFLAIASSSEGAWWVTVRALCGPLSGPIMGTAAFDPVRLLMTAVWIVAVLAYPLWAGKPALLLSITATAGWLLVGIGAQA